MARVHGPAVRRRPAADPGVGTTPEEQLLDGADRFVRFVSAHPEATRVIAREGAAPSPRLTYLIDRYLRPAFGAVVEALRAGQESGPSRRSSVRS